MIEGKATKQAKARQLFGTVGVNEVGTKWKDNALMRGGFTDAANSLILRK